jgi:hypothetical protein
MLCVRHLRDLVRRSSLGRIPWVLVRLLVGKAAQDAVLGAPNSDGDRWLRASARNFWYHRGGNISGSVTYWAFDCDNNADCLKAVDLLRGIRSWELLPWTPSG